MTPLRLLLFTSIFVVVSTLTASCFAADTHEAFLQGLRDRGYFGTALQYLDALSNDASTPGDVRTTLGLERAVIWMERSESARRQDDRDKFAGQGLAAFESFLNDYPRHPRAAWTHAQLGQVLFDRALHKLWIRNAPTNSTQRDELTAAGRQLLERAGKSFGLARDLYKTQLAEISFVNQEEDEPGYQLRQRTEDRYEQAWLSVVKCSYQMAMTHGPDSGRRTDLLEQAVEQCEGIYTNNRKGTGQDARLMIGKCRLALGDISQAIGYFDELRRQPAQDTHTLRLSHTAQYYRLTCLNHESRQEFRNVINEATRWLKQHPTARNTTAGLGILYEKAIATEALARSNELTTEQRQLRLRQTLADMEFVGAVSNPLREPARATARRLRDELGQDRREPKKFDTAFDRGREIIGRLQEARDAVKLAETENQQRRTTQELELLESEAGRMFELALELREHDSDRSAVAQARYLLSYVFLQQHKSYDAFVLARHVIRRHSEDAAETAANASEMAISAARQILAAAPKDDRMFELMLVREICEEIIQRFSGSRHATNARMQLGRIYLDLDQPQRGAEVFLQVPQDDTGYAAARIAAGRAWYRAWAQASDRDPAHSQISTGPATLIDWKQRARSLLTEGIHLSRVAQSDSRLTDEIVQAEVSLCGLMNADGDFSETVRHLAHGNPTVLSVVESTGERPQRGVRSTAFAGLCYRILLRAYVGAQQIDGALAMMQKLQALGATNTTSIYTQLGRELQRELKRLRDSGQDERLQQVRTSFEQFLEKVYSSRDRSSASALLWIAETYSDIARGIDNAAAAEESFNKASTIYQELLDSELADTITTRIKLRLIRIYRQQKKFSPALELGTEVLTNNPASVSVQLEVAHVLADWGESGEPERLLESIRGIPADQNPKTIWGWAALARRLQKSRQQEAWMELKPLFLESRFELSHSRLRYARIVPNGDRQQLEAATREIMSMAQVFNDLDDEWWSRFDGLYQEVQSQLGQPGLTLVRPHGDSVPGPDGTGAEPSAAVPAVAQDNSPVVQTPRTAGKKPSGHDRTNDAVFLVLGIGFMATVVGTVSFVIVRRPRRRVQYNSASDATGIRFATVTAKASPATQNPPHPSPSRKTKIKTGGKPKRPPRRPVSRSKSGATPIPPRRQRPRPPDEE